MKKTIIIIGGLTVIGVGAYLFFKSKKTTVDTKGADNLSNSGTVGLPNTTAGVLSNTGTVTSNSNEIGLGTTQSPIVYNTPSIEISPSSLSDLQAIVYANKYPDLLKLISYRRDLKILKNHWILKGKSENRTIPLVKNSVSEPKELSDDQALIYLAKYPDLFKSFGVNLSKAKQHWISRGKGEKRTIDIVI
jgi:hypothetical protein